MWIGSVFALLVIVVYQSVKLYKERKTNWKTRTAKLLLYCAMFMGTLFPWHINRQIENLDWHIFYNRRMRIVNEVKEGRLNPNVEWNGWVCELPYEFPIVSNGGNDIGILRNEEESTVTVFFWKFRNFFESASTEIVYSNDTKTIEKLEKAIERAPRVSWKITDNWYRIYDDWNY